MKLQMVFPLSIILSFTVLKITSINLSYSEIKYDSSPEDIKNTIEFNKNYTGLITEGKITFDYDKKLGTYCTARQNVKKAEFVIRVPNNFTICAYEIFPFMFELKDIIYSHLSRRPGANPNDTNSKTIKFLSAFRLLYHKNADQDKVENYLRKIGKEYYINRLNEQQQGYLNSLPKIVYNEPMFDKDDRRFGEMIGFPINPIDDYHDIFDSLNRQLRNSPHKDYILPWINDEHYFRLYAGYIDSRAFKIYLSDYEVGHNKSLIDMPGGRMLKQLLSELSPDSSFSCLLPFFDLCNTQINKDYYEKDKINFYIIWKNGYVMLGTSQNVDAGEEYMINYGNELTNEKLIMNYGFYHEGNNLSRVGFKSALSKQWLTKEKFEMLKNIIPYEHETLMAYNDYKLTEVPIKIVLNKFFIPNHILNLFRIYVHPSNKMNITKLETRIKQNKWLNYENEISAQSLFLFTLVRGDLLSKTNFVDLLQTIQITRNFYKENREEILRNQLIRYKYRLRRKMISVVREFRQIFFKNIEMVLDKFSVLLTDQFTKFRTQILLDISK